VNEFYTAPTGLIPLSTARSSNENSDREAVEVGFDKLPAEAELKRVQYGTDASTVATLYLIATPYTVAYSAGLTVTFTAIFENTGAASIQVNGAANVAIQGVDGLPLAGGEIRVGQVVTATYTAAGVFQLTASTSDANAAASASAALVSEQNAAASAMLFNEVANHYFRN